MQLKKKFALATVALMGALSLAGCGRGYNSGNGNQVGTIVRLGSHGAWCPSNEGEMALQNFRGGGSNSTLDFTVFDNDVYAKLKKAMEDRTSVEVTWEKRSMSGPCTMESDHIITAVKEFNDAGGGALNPKLAVTEQDGQADEAALPQGKTITLKCTPGMNNTLSCAKP
jgi:hypothetical protein